MFYTNRNGKAVPISAPLISGGSKVEIGTVLHYAGSEEPEGWLICDGRELDINGYKDLFEVIGYTYGGSNGKFKLPDFRETAAVGVGTRSSSVDVYTLGEFKNDQFASHTHSQASHTHTGVAHCHPTAVSHSHTLTHCHSYTGSNSVMCYGCYNGSGNFMRSTTTSASTSAATFTLNSASFTSSSYGAHNSGNETAVNCNAGAETGTRGRRIALNFIIYTGAKK